MPQPPAPPAAHKKRQRQMLIAGVALAGLLILFLRSRNARAAAPAQQAAVDPNAQQQALPAGSGMTPSTFADNGAQAGALGDAVTSGLSGVQTALADLQAQQAQQQQAGSTAGAGATGPGSTPTVTTTINNYPGGANTPGSPNPPTPGTTGKNPPKIKLPPNPAGGGHYVNVGGKAVLIHWSQAAKKWVPGPPPHGKGQARK